MKATEKAKLHQMTSSQLQLEVTKLQKDLVIAQLNHQLRKNKDTNQSKKIRKDIARIKTILHQKQLTNQANSTQTPPKSPSKVAAEKPSKPAKKSTPATRKPATKKSTKNTNQK